MRLVVGFMNQAPWFILLYLYYKLYSAIKYTIFSWSYRPTQNYTDIAISIYNYQFMNILLATLKLLLYLNTCFCIFSLKFKKFCLLLSSERP